MKVPYQCWLFLTLIGKSIAVARYCKKLDFLSNSVLDLKPESMEPDENIATG